MQVHSIILRKSFSIAPCDANRLPHEGLILPVRADHLYMQLIKLYMHIITGLSSADKGKATQPGHFAGKRWQTDRRLRHEQDGPHATWRSSNDQPAGGGHGVVGRSSPRGAR